MKLKTFLACSIISLSAVAGYSQKANKQFAVDLINKYKSAKSIAYDATYKIKHFDYDNNDTVNVKGHCELIRDSANPVFGGYVWFDSEEKEGNTSTFYNLKDIFVIQHAKKEILKFDVSRGYTGPMLGATQASMKNTGFLNPDKLLTYINANKTVIKDTVINNADFVSIAIHFPDDEETNNRIYTLYVNKQQNEIRKITYTTHLLDQHQYDEWNLSNIQFNTVTPTTLNAKLNSFAGIYSAADFEPSIREDVPLLEKGSPAPYFAGKVFNSNTKVAIADYKDKIIILDFWYIGCYPCAQAVPHLNALQEKYKKDVVVIGINPIDPYDKSLVKAGDYIKRHKIIYPLASVDADTAKQYNVSGYPTLYIIDRKGKVQFSATGYSDNMEKDLSEIIDWSLRK